MNDPNCPRDHNERLDASSAQSRRSFLGRFAALGAAGLGLSGALAACGGGEDGEATTTMPAEQPETEGGAQTAGVQASECEGYDALTEQDLQMRETLGYVDESPNPEQLCSNCRFYTQPAEGDVCGGCQLFAGPVAPDGYCNSWAAMES